MDAPWHCSESQMEQKVGQGVPFTTPSSGRESGLQTFSLLVSQATCEQACVTNKRVRAGCGGKCQVINPLVCLDALGSALTALHPRKPLSPLQNWTLGYPTHQPEQYHGKLRYSWLHYDLLFFPTTSKCSDCSSTNTKLLSYKTGKHWVRLNVGNGEICGQL